MSMNPTYYRLRLITTIILLLFYFVLSNLPLYAALPPGKFQIRGVATDAESGKTIAYATITAHGIHGIVKRLATDADGKF